MIELDELLTGTPTMEQVAEFWKNGELHDERYLVHAIEKRLLTEDQRLALFNARISIEKILNGEYEYNGTNEVLVSNIFSAWNTKLGFRAFGG